MSWSSFYPAAFAYLCSGVFAGAYLAFPKRGLQRAALACLGAGGLFQLIGLISLHSLTPPPPIGGAAAILSLSSLVGVCAYLVLLYFVRIAPLVLVVAPLAFLSLFWSGQQLHGSTSAQLSSTTWSHVHILLASGGLALLGLAGIAGGFFLREHQRLKHKSLSVRTSWFPSLEALDRLNKMALAVGFPLLTLGLITALLWNWDQRGDLWSGTVHEVWSYVAWAGYVVVAFSRVFSKQSSKRAAQSALLAFVFLLFAALGVRVSL